MKNLLLILATIIPMALTGQSEATKTITPINKNAITASTYLGTSSGLALDYRRELKKNREFVIGAQTSYSGLKGINIGFRKYFHTEKDLSFGFGVDAGLKQRNIIGDNLISRALENTLLKVDTGEIRFVAGAYYKLNDKLDLMGEIGMRPIISIFRNSNSNKNAKVGLRYNF